MTNARRTKTRKNRGKKFTRKEAAAYVGVQTCTLAAWASRGHPQLPYHRVGGKSFYFQADCDDLIENGRIVPEEAAA